MTTPEDNTRMIARIEERIIELKQNQESGQAQLRALDQRRAELEQTLLRISGAIAVLEPMLLELREAGQ